MIEEEDKALEPEIDEEGRNVKTGKFAPGNVVAKRKKGKRHKLNQALLDHMIMRGEQGKYPWEAITELADTTLNEDLRFKCEAKFGDWAMNPNLIVASNEDEDVSDDQLKEAVIALILSSKKHPVVETEEESATDE